MNYMTVDRVCHLRGSGIDCKIIITQYDNCITLHCAGVLVITRAQCEDR